ncbi:MAG: hypothetical protein AB9891_15405 [Anaerolineaceae bacterium]
MDKIKETLRNLGFEGWVFSLTSMAAIIFSVLSFLGILPFDSEQTSSIVIGALGLLMAAMVTQIERRHTDFLKS